MTTTEAYETVFELAMREARRSGADSRERRALVIVGTKARILRHQLDASRRHRAFQKLQSDSYVHLRDELSKISACDVCRWQFERRIDGVTNPMLRCTGDFGCALECLRYKSSEWLPGILPPKPQTPTAS